jgi:GT2 family glycosyltransferase
MAENHSAQSSPPRLGFLIVNWNRASLLQRCLESLQRHLPQPFTILVVDNASSDGSAAMVRSRFPSVRLIENQENLGFGKANNIGIQYLRTQHQLPDILIFLNNDTVLQDGSLTTLIDTLESREEIIAAIPSVFEEEGKLQTGIAGYELSLATAFNYFFFLSILFPRAFRGFFLHQRYFRRRQQACAVEWISGVCLILKTAALQPDSGFPEDYFMYAEDLAFCRELRHLGKIIYFPGAQILHHRDTNQDSAPETMWLDSLFLYYRKQNQRPGLAWRLFLLKVIFLKGFALRFLGYSLFSSLNPSLARRARHMKLYMKHIWQGLVNT